MDHDIETLCKEIHSLASPLNFEQSNTESFRGQIQRCVKSAVNLSLLSALAKKSKSRQCISAHNSNTYTNSKTNRTRHRYDGKVLNDILFYSSDESSSSWRKYHPRGIKWDALCTSHDDCVQRMKSQSYQIDGNTGSASGPEKRVSCLQIVISVIVDPTIIPPCCASIILHGLLSVCFETFSSSSYLLRRRTVNEFSSSMNEIQKSFVYVQRSRPVAMLSTECLETYVTEQLMGNLSIQNNEEIQMGKMKNKNLALLLTKKLMDYDIERSQLIFSVMKELLVSIKGGDDRGWGVRTILLHPAIMVLKEIDALDSFLLEKKRRKKTKGREFCTECRSILDGRSDSFRTRKSNKSMKLNNLHGEISEDEDVEIQKKVAYNDSFGRIPIRRNHDAAGGGVLLPLKEIMNSSSSKMRGTFGESCYICSKKDGMKKYGASDITTLPLPMVEFRASLYQLVMQSANLHQLSSSPIQAKRRHMLFHARVVMENYQSASLRLSALICANCLGIENGYLEYLRLLFKAIHKSTNNISSQQSCNKAIGCIYIYHELLQQCAIFDDPIICWKGMEPLIDLVLKLEGSRQTSGTATNLEMVIGELLKSIGLLLSTRITAIWKKDPLEEPCISFNCYVLRLSEAFGNGEQWIENKNQASYGGAMSTVQSLPTPTLSYVEQIQILSGLQMMGILSLFNGGINGLKPHAHKGSWPFEELHSLRAVYMRMGPKVICSNGLLTNVFCIGQEMQTNYRRKKRPREDFDAIEEGSEFDPVIIDCISDDLTRLVFSYLGYKLLVRATSVCKLWHRIGNENYFWQPHYIKRFRPIFLEEILPDFLKVSIRKSFIEKHCQRHNLEWRRIFDDKWAKEKSICKKVSKDGWKYQGCRMFGCMVTFRKKAAIFKHCQTHHKYMMKKIKTLEKAEAREDAKLEREFLEWAKIRNEEE